MTQALLEELKITLLPSLVDFLNTRFPGATDTPEFKDQARRRIERLASRGARRQWDVLTPQERQQLVEELLDEVLGLGPLGGLLRDRSVSEIMVNGLSEVFIERDGRVERLNRGFRDHNHLLSVIEKLLASVGRQVTQLEPCADVRLPDGSRINVAIPPIAVGGPYVTIRKFTHDIKTLDDLIRTESLNAQAGQFLQLCVRGRLNLVVSGPASSGKTVLLNLLLSSVTPVERLIIIEDAVELQVRHPNVVRLATRPPSIEGRGELAIRQLLRSALHMRPDRIVIGEVRGAEALDMLQAMNTGHDGSMTTLHANSPADVFERITTMALMSELELSALAIQRQARSAIDLIVQMERSVDGSRNVSSIQEVVKEPDATGARLTELYTRTRDPAAATSGRLRATGAVPQCVQKLARRGMAVPPELFRP